MPRVVIHTLGCKVNQADSRELAIALARRGCQIVMVGPADAVVVNTCVVTATAEAKCRQVLRGLGRKFPGVPVYAIGCGSRRHDLSIDRLPGVIVLSAMDPEELAEQLTATIGRGDPVQPPSGRTRALLRVQSGCRRDCAYCIVPSVRGQPRSISPQGVIAAAQELHTQGYREIVVCGTNLGTYGRDLEPAVTLSELMRQLPTSADVRYRLSSLEPLDVEPDLVRLAVTSPGICRHLHLVMQSGSPRVLSAMGREGSLERIRTLISAAREADPRCAVTTDLIAGFPGETEDDHRLSLQAIAELGFSRVHVFPFSPRPGTRAASLCGQLPPEVRVRRARELVTAAQAQAARFIAQQLGTDCRVLVERTDGRGLSDHYLRVTIRGWRGSANRLVVARLVQRRGPDVVGELKQG